MSKLYKSSSGIIHLVLGGYTCKGKVKPNLEGTRDRLTCRNCLERLNF